MKTQIGILEGILSIESAISSKSRPIHHIYIDKQKVYKRDRKTLRFLKLLEKESIKPELCDRELIDNYSAELGNTHGGIIAITGERQYLSCDELLQKIKTNNSYAVMLDGIEDPYNFGYALRNLYASDAGGVIIPQRNWMDASNICARASGGASELMDISIMPTDNDSEFLSILRKNQIGVVCSALTGNSISLFDYEPKFPFVLFVGGEKRGISGIYVENSDANIHIPYKNKKARYSLPVAGVTAVLGFELQRKMGTF